MNNKKIPLLSQRKESCKSMSRLDLMVQEMSITSIEYEENKEIISMYFNGDLRSDRLPLEVRDVLLEWEIEGKESVLELQPMRGSL